jgi:hypothetical protein
VEKSDPVKTWLAPTGAKPMGHDDDDDDVLYTITKKKKNLFLKLMEKMFCFVPIQLCKIDEMYISR